jgi:hypothetical protein
MSRMMDITRRNALVALAGGAAASLAVACRTSPAGEDAAIRGWFRERYNLELEDDALAPIREYLHQTVKVSDPGLQPPLLFDPEVDVG